jgi:hypothetical protein
MRRHLAAIAVLATALPLPLAAPGMAAPSSCETAMSVVQLALPGPLPCRWLGKPAVVVARHTTLPMHSLRLTVVRLGSAHAFSSDVGGVRARAWANGVYAVVTVRVQNMTSAPVQFDGYAQTELTVGHTTYPYSSDTDVDPDGVVWRTVIPARRSATGDLLFDIPKSAIRAFPGEANLLVLNFGQDLQHRDATQFGIVDLTR